MKIAEFVKINLIPLLLSEKIPQSEIDNLTNKDYCKSVFGLYVPMLKKSTGNTVYRYYSPKTTTLVIYGTEYLLTNDWYDDIYRHQLGPLQNWMKQYDNVVIEKNVNNVDEFLTTDGLSPHIGSTVLNEVEYVSIE